MKSSRAPQQAESGDHTYQSEAVVSVQMGNEDMTQFRKSHPAPAELHLRTLGTV